MSDNSLRILVMNYEYPPVGGGGGVICRDLCDELVRAGHRVTVVTSQFADLKTHEVVNGVDIHRVAVLMRSQQAVASLPSMLSYKPRAVKLAVKLHKQQAFDLVSTHFAIPTGPAGHKVAQVCDLPNVLSIYGGDIYDPSKKLSPHKTPMLKTTVRKMLKRADRVISDSVDVAEKAQHYYDIKENIDVIPLAIHPNSHGKRNRKELGLNSNDLIITTLGRLIARKDVPALVRSVASLPKEVSARLLVMGDGPQKETIEEEVQRLGIADRVELLGRVTDAEKFQIMGVSDIYASTATHEGFGIVFLEAMECGLPVICYDGGGQVDFLRDNLTGYLVSLGEEKTFTLYLEKLATDAELRKKISEHNSEYVKEYYAEHYGSQFLKAFREEVRAYKSRRHGMRG